MRNVLLVITVLFFIVAFFVTPGGCAGFTSQDNVDWVCDDPSGVGELISQVAHLLFVGLALLSAALIDWDVLLHGKRPAGD